MLQSCYINFQSILTPKIGFSDAAFSRRGSRSCIDFENGLLKAFFWVKFCVFAQRFFAVTSVTWVIKNRLKPFMVLSDSLVTACVFTPLLSHYCYILSHYCYTYCHTLLLHGFLSYLKGVMSSKGENVTVKHASRRKKLKTKA